MPEPGAGLRGIILGTLLIAAFTTLAYLFTALTGPVRYAQGRVEAFIVTATDATSYAVARVRVGDQVGNIRVPRAAQCRTGDRIELQGRRNIFGGLRYGVASGGCSR